MNIEVKSNDRVFVCGRTGSGKSYLVKNLLIPRMTNYVIYDYKSEIEIPGAVVFTRINDFKKNPNQHAIIYQTQSGTDKEFDALCKQVFYRGNNTLILDETAYHCTQSKIMRHHGLIMQLGRSKGVGIINCTQRPRGIHNNIISQCEHFFTFDLTQGTDRDKLADFCGEQLEIRAKEYHFWYYHVSHEEATFCAPVKV